MNQLDILYTPLDVPDRPHTDKNQFMQWAKEAYPTDEQITVRRDLSKGSSYNTLEPEGEYAWDMVYARFDDKWLSGFDEKFPELAKYSYEIFGVHLHEVATLVFLPLRNTVMGEAFWHNDVDTTGFRYYLFNEKHEENPLLIRRCNHPYLERPRLPVPLPESDPRVSQQRMVCKMRSPTQAYYLNNIRCVHAPTINSTEPILRVAGFLKCKNKYQPEVFARSQNLIVNSALKFKDLAIFW